jgi:hypothetical protein
VAFPNGLSAARQGPDVTIAAAWRQFASVRMTTRLNALVPGPTDGEIAGKLGQLVLSHAYALPSNRAFYGGYALSDGVSLLLAASLTWQTARRPGWVTRFRGTPARQPIAAIFVITFNGLLAAGARTAAQRGRAPSRHPADNALICRYRLFHQVNPFPPA